MDAIALAEILAELREWASDPTAVMYVFNPTGRPRLVLFPEDVLGLPSDEDLAAHVTPGLNYDSP